jgi:hypothetical protein
LIGGLIAEADHVELAKEQIELATPNGETENSVQNQATGSRWLR